MSVARRVILVAVGALVIVLGLGLVSIVRSEGVPSPDPTPTQDQVEETLFLQVLDADGYARGNVVIGIEPPATDPLTVFLAVPASLLVAAGDDSVTLGTTPQSADTLAAVTAIEESLALRVDAGSVEVHHIEWVKVNSTRFAVSRHRREKWERQF